MKQRKKIFIMGDSYSTYEGYIPEGYDCFYSDERTDKPILDGVEKTWWRILSKEENFDIVINDSLSGSTICNTRRPTQTIDTTFVSRINKYISEKFFDENEIDIFFIFGGTNDSWIESPVGKLKYSDWDEEDLKCVLPAFCYLLSKAKEVSKKVIPILNTDLKPEIIDNFIVACEKYQLEYVKLEEIDKENGHPSVLGMRQIATQVKNLLN